jgi:hypothetical protein
MPVLGFTDPNRTRWPVDEVPKTDLANNASVPQADELVKAFDISTDLRVSHVSP